MTIELKKNNEGQFEAEKLHTAAVCVGAVIRGLGLAVADPKVRSLFSETEEEGTIQGVVQAVEKLGMKARLVVMKAQGLANLKTTSIAYMKNGRYVALGRCDGKAIVVLDPLVGAQRPMPLEEFATIWSGQLVMVKQPWSLKVKQFKQRFNLQWFTSIILRYRRLLWETVAAAFFLQFFGLITPLFTQVIIDKVLPNNGLSTLNVLATALFILGLFQALMSMLRTYLLTHTTTKIDVILGTQLFRHISALPLQYFETRRVGDTLMRVAAMNTIREFLTSSTITAVLDAFFSVVFIAVMMYYSVPLTLLALVVVPVYLLMNVKATPIFQEKLEKVWAAGAASNSFMVEAITGIHTMKALAIEPQFVHRWEKLLASNVGASFDKGVFSMAISNTGGLIRTLSGFSVLWYGGHMVMDGQMTIGQLIAFQMISTQASNSFLHLVSMWQNVQQVGLSIERIGDIINSPPEAMLAGNGSQRPKVVGEIRIEGLNFRYRRETDLILKNVTMHIPAGCRVGIVGRSGSGKSTLTKLVQRLYLPEGGRITLDGMDLNQMDPVWLRRHIGVVLQDNYLFNGSVRDNIATAVPSASMEEVIRASIVAGAHDFILELHEGYDTKVGERGMSLSGGQRQRIAIARALLTNPRILIFDEATSALDYESERIIMDNLDAICAGRTMLMIAHRLSTVKHCDHIVVLDRGEVVEQGSHETLMGLKGLYYNLYLQQEG